MIFFYIFGLAVYSKRNIFATLVCLSLSLETLVPLFSDSHPDTVALRQGHVRLATLADHKDVSQTGGEGVTVVVLEATRKTSGLRFKQLKSIARFPTKQAKKQNDNKTIS